MNDKKKKRIVQIAVVLLIAAVVVTYSVTFVGDILLGYCFSGRADGRVDPRDP